jgi:hypothetical protein
MNRLNHSRNYLGNLYTFYYAMCPMNNVREIYMYNIVHVCMERERCSQRPEKYISQT